MKKTYIWYLVIGIFILTVPTAIYLGFLIPQMKEEYIILMSSGGVITTGGMYGSSLIPEKVKFSSLYKLSARSFTLLTAVTLVQEFIMQLIGVVIVFIVSFIIFTILKECFKTGRRRYENGELAKEISRNLNKDA